MGRVCRVVSPILRRDSINDDLAASILRVGVAAALAGVSAQTALHLINRAWWRSEQLNADVDGNLLTLFASGALLVGAAAALLLAAVGGRRFQFLLLAAVLALFAVDEVVALHERVSLRATAVLGVDNHFARALWPALYLPLLAFTFVTLWQVARAATRVRFPILVGLALLVAAVGVEMIWSSWHLSGGEIGDWPDTVEVALEEGLELGGWILIGFGLLAAALARHRFSRGAVGLRRNAPRVAIPPAE